MLICYKKLPFGGRIKASETGVCHCFTFYMINCFNISGHVHANLKSQLAYNCVPAQRYFFTLFFINLTAEETDLYKDQPCHKRSIDINPLKILLYAEGGNHVNRGCPKGLKHHFTGGSCIREFTVHTCK